MKPLTDLAVLRAAEELMFQNNETTTLEVKNLLRKQGYEALQAEVSSRMENVAKQESWQIKTGGAYRVYLPAVDTAETLHAYWESSDGKHFWEVRTTRKTVEVYTGEVGTDGDRVAFDYRSNREAIRETQTQMQDKRAAGYLPAQDKRLPAEIRQKLAGDLGKKAQSIVLAYFGVLQRRGAGETVETVEGGYEFVWDLPTEAKTLKELFAQEKWNPLEQQKPLVNCLGEKVIAREAAIGAQQHTAEVFNKKLFQAKIAFADGTNLRLNRYDGIFADKADKRKPSPFFWAVVQKFIG